MAFPTLRAVVTGSLMLVVIAIWQQQGSQLAGSFEVATTRPPIPAIAFLFLVLLLINPLLGKVKAGLRYAASELYTVLIMVLVGSPLLGTGWAQSLLPSRVAFRYYATLENNYERDFFAYTRKWYGPNDPETVRAFFEGGAERVPWLEWLPTLLVWCSFSLVLYFTCICLVALIKDQWVERERLSFPILKLPIELLQGFEDGRHGLLRNKMTWLGAAIPFVIHTVNGLNAYFPGFPALTTGIDLSRHLQLHPWNAMQGIGIFFRPVMIGIGYLMNLDVAFSCWFFFLFQKLMLAVSAAMAWSGTDSPLAGFPFLQQQERGAILALTVIYIWVMRRQLRGSFRAAFFSGGGSRPVRHSLGEGGTAPTEVGHYRIAWLGFISGSIFILGFCGMMGMSIAIGAVFFFLIFSRFLVLSRFRAEAGIPPIYGAETPAQFLAQPFGSKALGTRNLVGMAFLGWVMQDTRAAVMPNILEGYKLSESGRKRIKGLMLIMVVALLVAMCAGIWTQLELSYKYGLTTLNDWRRMEAHKHFQNLSALVQNPQRPVRPAVPMLFVGVGAGFTVLLSFLRTRLLWWPLHPLGYAAGTFALHFDWSGIFFGWLFRLVVFRLAGSKGYRRFLPFFLGLILGDLIMLGFWGILGCTIRGAGYYASGY